MTNFFSGKTFGELLDGFVFNAIFMIVLWVGLTKGLQAPLLSLCLAIGITILIRPLVRNNKKVRNLVQFRKKLMDRVEVQKQVQAMAPEELVKKVMLNLGIQDQEEVTPKAKSWGEYYLRLADKPVSIAVGQFPGQTVGESTVQKFMDFVEENEHKVGYYFTTGTFSPRAIELTQEKGTIELINLSGIVTLFQETQNLSDEPLGKRKRISNLAITEEIVSFNDKKIRKFGITALVLSVSSVMVQGNMRYYFLVIAAINLILALLSLKQNQQQRRLAFLGLKRLQTQ